jgi:hypothetical protein
MKKKIGTLLEEEILSKAKERAQRDGRPLADVIQDALDHYLQSASSNEDGVRAAEKFCAHGVSLRLDEIDEILSEEVLAL